VNYKQCLISSLTALVYTCRQINDTKKERRTNEQAMDGVLEKRLYVGKE